LLGRVQFAFSTQQVRGELGVFLRPAEIEVVARKGRLVCDSWRLCVVLGPEIQRLPANEDDLVAERRQSL
jgi:hypothetical protein